MAAVAITAAIHLKVGGIMRILYGSQNFGYELEYSDTDYAEIAIPSLDQLINREQLYKQIKIDTGIVKVFDIRYFNKIVNGASFSDLQLLYSQEYIDCEIIMPLLEIRRDILIANLWRTFKCNSSVIESSLKENNSKGLTRAYTYTELLSTLLKTGCNLQTFRNPRTGEYRISIGEAYDTPGYFAYNWIEAQKQTIKMKLDNLEAQYKKMEGKENTNTVNKVRQIVREIIRERIVNEQ